MANPVNPVQILDDEEFCEDKIDIITCNANVGNKYALVAIMGRQGSGKSTLLNELFGTAFGVRPRFEKPQQTTKGIWMSTTAWPETENVLVMDLEGCDSGERGDDGVNLERKYALFALSVADALMINVKSLGIKHNVVALGPLLKAIFQLKLTVPVLCGEDKQPTTLLVVVRDKTEDKEEIIKATIQTELETIWREAQREGERDSETTIIATAGAASARELQGYFNISFQFLSNANEEKDDFDVQVSQLRERFASSGGTLLKGAKRELAVLKICMRKLWSCIQEQEKLNNVVSMKVLSTECVCEASFERHRHVFEDGLAGITKGSQDADQFTGRVKDLWRKCIMGYNADTSVVEVIAVQVETRNKLIKMMENILEPIYKDCLKKFRNTMEAKCKEEFVSNKQPTLPAVLDKCVKRFREQCEITEAGASLVAALEAEVEKFTHSLKSYAVSAELDKLKVKMQQELTKITTELLRDIKTWPLLYTQTNDVLARHCTDMQKNLVPLGQNADTGGQELLKATIQTVRSVCEQKAIDKTLALLMTETPDPRIHESMKQQEMSVEEYNKNVREKGGKILATDLPVIWSSSDSSTAGIIRRSIQQDIVEGRVPAVTAGNYTCSASDIWYGIDEAQRDVVLLTSENVRRVWEDYLMLEMSKRSAAASTASTVVLDGLASLWSNYVWYVQNVLPCGYLWKALEPILTKVKDAVMGILPKIIGTAIVVALAAALARILLQKWLLRSAWRLLTGM